MASRLRTHVSSPGKTSIFQTDTGGGFVICPDFTFAVNIAIDPTRPCSTSYAGSTRQLLIKISLNPDLVGEIRLILSPIDAELGRGNSQIQIQTRSGTNRYTGSANWNVRNTALNANSWGNNNDTVGGVWTPTRPDWRNTHNYTVSYGGPDHSQQDIFLCVLGSEHFQYPGYPEHTGADGSGPARAFSGFGRGWVPKNANSANNGSNLTGGQANNPSVRSVDDLGRPLNPSPQRLRQYPRVPEWHPLHGQTGLL